MSEVLPRYGGDDRPEIAQVPARRPNSKPTTRRVGYLVAAVVNGAMLWVANHLLGWGWPPFLTNAFEDLLPWVNVSLVAAIAVNLVWTWRDPAWFKQLAQLVLNAISLVVIVRSWQIFPLDFTGYWSGWEALARVALGIACFGVIVDSVTRIVGLTTAAGHPDTRFSPDRMRSRPIELTRRDFVQPHRRVDIDPSATPSSRGLAVRSRR